ncbi:DUF6212 domain-containing protein [Roseomonas chloroacetimidivorans]|uniref:DUF6212 domain-containing protein n=1 Tax=Roseomonas chloroacetimidivorans TaxID=1766656 RepID=UPI003C78A7C2
MTLRADPAHLPRLAGASTIVIVAEGVMDPSPLAAAALDVWMVSSRDGEMLLHPAGTRPPAAAEAVALETPPTGALALVASERIRIAPVTRWWTEASGLPAPPFILAGTGQLALPGLLTLLAGELSATRAREAEAARALVVARQELEETREAMVGVSRLLAHRPPVAPRVVLSGEAGDGPPVEAPARHIMGTGLAGLAAIAVHVAAPGQGSGLMRLRLLGAESDQVVGSWAVPAGALPEGWLLLDLPTPLGPLKETAVLEVTAEGDGVPALSRDARWAGEEGEHPLALRAWAGAPGDRYLAPAFWAPDEIGLALPRAGIPLALPAAAWEAARPLEGRAEAVALGEEAPRPLLRAAAHERSVLLLPLIQAPGLDRVRITFAEPSSDGGSVAAWVQPADADHTSVVALERPGRGASWTGWRPLAEDGATLTLPLSPLLEGRASLAIGVRAGSSAIDVEVSRAVLSAERPGQAPASIPDLAEMASPSTPPQFKPSAEPVGPTLVAPAIPSAPERLAAHPAEAPALAVTGADPSPVPPSPVAAPAEPTRPAAVGPAPAAPRIRARYETVRLHQHLPGASYQHVDLTVVSLTSGAARWASVRVKFALKDGEPRMEFRQAPGWPHVFRDWLGRASDKFGPFLRIALPELREFLGSITDERDAAMMRALIAVLPRAIEDGCRQAGLSVADTADWVAKAKQVQEEEALVA